jgi:dipeptidase E
MVNALLLSNSTMPGTSFFTWAAPFVTPFLSGRKNLLFVPYAAVTFSFEDYTARVNEVFEHSGLRVSGLHNANDPVEAINNADGIVVGGGNTFALLQRLYEQKCVNHLRQRILAGVPYVGWSAGANLAGPTIMTTNDMPIVQPPSFESLGIVPFQINPHYHELKFAGQGGETRRERLEEFMVMNPDKKVIGLPEGMLLHRSGDSLTLRGTGTARLYQAGSGITDLPAGDDVSFLL